MNKVSGPQVVTAAGAAGSPLPPQIQEALGELVGAAREGLLALSVGVGLGVVHELMGVRGLAVRDLFARPARVLGLSPDQGRIVCSRIWRKVPKAAILCACRLESNTSVVP